MSGEEAYQRRLAMSTNVKPASQTTSSTSAPIVVDAAYPAATTGSPAPPARAETGEEAYLRRVALSQGPLPSLTKPAPLQLPPSTGDEAYQRRAALSTQQVSPPPPQNEREPSEPASDSSGNNPFTPQSTLPLPPPPPSTASADNVNPDFEERVRNSRSAAAAIAARFSVLAPAEDRDLPEPAPEESRPGPSARYTP